MAIEGTSWRSILVFVRGVVARCAAARQSFRHRLCSADVASPQRIVAQINFWVVVSTPTLWQETGNLWIYLVQPFHLLILKEVDKKIKDEDLLKPRTRCLHVEFPTAMKHEEWLFPKKHQQDIPHRPKFWTAEPFSGRLRTTRTTQGEAISAPKLEENHQPTENTSGFTGVSRRIKMQFYSSDLCLLSVAFFSHS